MKKVRIGKTDIRSLPLGYGTNALGGHNLFPGLDDDLGVKILRTALNANIKFLDTAFAYGMGKSEKLIGSVLKSYDRKDIIISTKGGQRVLNNGKIVIDNSPQFIRDCVYSSLRRLGTDYIDIYYVHFPDERTPKAETIRALDELKRKGIIRAIGVSNFSMAQLKEANEENLIDIDEEQYNLIHREAERERFQYLRENDISFVPFFPLASGLLTGKYTSEVSFSSKDMRYNNPDFQGERFLDLISRVNQLRILSNKYQATISQIVLAWYIKNPDITVVIPGAKKLEQFNKNKGALSLVLSDLDYQLVSNIFRS